MTRLHDLYRDGGQSPWIDDLKRSYLSTGELQHLIDVGVRGMTSNPTIMANAIEAGTDYDEQFFDLMSSKATVDDAYWDLVLYDVERALATFRGLYDSSRGTDGFVSVEVAPNLAHDTSGTINAAQYLHSRLSAPNALVKIPATIEGLPAIEQTIASGHSVNVTLIFSLDRYDAVMEAYLHGLERLHDAGGDVSSIASVASFFVSRVDTEVDRRLQSIAEAGDDAVRDEVSSLYGTAALAQARIAYRHFLDTFATPRAKALLDRGAHVQRPLWASTSTKNPKYPDLLYVDGLVGPDTVNTMPQATIDAFLDHGDVERTLDRSFDDAAAVLERLSSVGVDLDDVTAQLEREGVASFSKSFDELIESLHRKAAAKAAS